MGQLYSMERDNLKGTTLEPSISCLAKQQIDPLIANPENVAAFANGPRTIYVVGYFDYRDRIGRVFRTAFCRKWDSLLSLKNPCMHKANSRQWTIRITSTPAKDVAK